MKIILIFFVLLALSSFSLRAQEFISATQDFSTINVAELSDEQIEKIKIELLNRNVKFEELLPYLSSKGMSLSAVGVGSLRGAAPSTRGPEWTDLWWTGCHANGIAG